MTLEDLVRVAGARATEHAPFGAHTTYRVGGTARVVVQIETRADLLQLGSALAGADREIVVFGNGSNLLVADGEFDGIAVHFGAGFATLDWRDDEGRVRVLAGAALALPVAARQLAENGVVGFEWAVGVPGTFGGAAVMNAGGHGSDMAHSVHDVTLWRWSLAREETWPLADLDYGYRRSALANDHAVVSVALDLARGDAAGAREAIRDIVRWRREHQPGGSNAGSVFTNPPNGYAGELIDRAGLRGRRLGSASVSDKHANFIQVDTNGRANDVRELMDVVRAEVLAATGIELVSELRTVGFPRESR